MYLVRQMKTVCQMKGLYLISSLYIWALKGKDGQGHFLAFKAQITPFQTNWTLFLKLRCNNIQIKATLFKQKNWEVVWLLIGFLCRKSLKNQLFSILFAMRWLENGLIFAIWSIFNCGLFVILLICSCWEHLGCSLSAENFMSNCCPML